MNFFKIKRKILLSFVLPIPYKKLRTFALKESGFDIGNQVYIGQGLILTLGYCDRNMKLLIEDRVSIAPNVTIVLASHPNHSKLCKIVKSPPRKVIICADSWIGTGVIIMPGVTIGECSIVGAGSVVTHDIPPYTISVGNPAKVIKEIDRSLL